MIMLRRIYHWRPVIQVLIGLCLGVALSIIASPFLNACHSDGAGEGVGVPGGEDPPVLAPMLDPGKASPVLGHNKISRASDSKDLRDDQINFDYWNNDDFEPRVVKPATKEKVKGKENSNKPKKQLRPRYISTELGIREKLFVGVLTTKDTLDNFGVAVNRTLSHYVTKLVFFMNFRHSTLPNGVSIVIFSDLQQRLVPFHMMKYVGDHYVKNYDWFFFLKDNAYVNGQQLFDLVSRLSITEDVLLGNPIYSEDGFYCDIGSGILMSQSLMTAVTQRSEWCMENFVSQNDALNLGQCVLHAAGHRHCDSSLKNQELTFYHNPGFHFAQLDTDPVVKQTIDAALTVAPIAVESDLYRLHRYYCERELRRVHAELELVKNNITEIAPQTPAGPASVVWPTGTDAPTQPRSRFDVIKWDYITETHIYLDGDFNNVHELKGVHKEDIQDVMRVSAERLSTAHPGRYTMRGLVNGYRRFDAQRGMEYILDLRLLDSKAGADVVKRVNLMRPLGQVELVPMPYVTENSRVNLILPVTKADRNSVLSFLDSYAHICLDSGDNTYLFVVFIYGEAGGLHARDKDSFAMLKSMIGFYENKYQTGARIAWTELQASSPSQFIIMDAISRKFSGESLFLLCSVGMELTIEFLNRVRMNSIANWQVFFPIGFWQYKPNLIYDEKPYPTTIEIKEKVGHYDPDSYHFASFYNSDYQYARKQMISTSTSSHDLDLYDMFLRYHSVHVLRAVEPALKLRHVLRECSPSSQEDAYRRCLLSRKSGLASRAQLAMLLFEHQQKLDQQQMNLMHQQNDANVGQMKPDMLK